MSFYSSPYVHLRGRRRYVFAQYFLVEIMGLKKLAADALKAMDLHQLEELAVEGYWVSRQGVETYCQLHGIERIPPTTEE